MPSSDDSPGPSKVQPRRNLIFIWAVGGVVALLTQSILRLGAIAWEALSSGEMATWQLVICGVWVVTNCYAEGHRGFHLRFVPRVLARAHHLALHPTPKLVAFAPLFSMAFFHASRRAKIGAWIVTVAVIIAIVVVRQIAQPWRGIIDAGVVAGLTWGTISMLIGAISRLLGSSPSASPELAETSQQPISAE